jgi:hypothetical protein
MNSKLYPPNLIHDINSSIFALQTVLPTILDEQERENEEEHRKIMRLSLEKLDKLADSWQSLKDSI